MDHRHTPLQCGQCHLSGTDAPTCDPKDPKLYPQDVLTSNELEVLYPDHVHADDYKKRNCMLYYAKTLNKIINRTLAPKKANHESLNHANGSQSDYSKALSQARFLLKDYV